MAELKPKKMSLTDINNGQEFTENDGISPSWANDVFESVAYSQRQVELIVEKVDTSEIDKEGTPTFQFVSYVENGIEYKEIKVSNLKGKTGSSGLPYGTSLSNEYGESDTNGYTQQAVNNLLYRPNILINGDFRVNQRGKTKYSGSRVYCVDRWFLVSGFIATPAENGIKLKPDRTTYTYSDMVQFIESAENLTGKKVTLSISVNGIVYKRTYLASTTMATENISIRSFGDVRLTYSSQRNCYMVGLYDTNTQNPNNAENTINWVKLEIGETATPIVPRAYAEELALCQRYYNEIKSTSEDNRLVIDNVMGTSTTTGYSKIDLPVPMRSTPTMFYSDIGYSQDNSYINSVDKIDYANITSDNRKINIFVEGTFVIGRPYMLSVGGDGYLAFDAEIY